MSFGGSAPDAPNPAKRPERRETLEPEDIAIGEDEEETSKKGRRALLRPRGNTVNEGSGKAVGTGLSA